MVQVIESAFKNVKVKSTSLIDIKQAMDVGVLTNHTLILNGGYVNKDMVPTVFPLPGAWIGKLTKKL